MILMRREQLKELIREAVREALTVEMTIERRRDPETGQPLAVPRVEKETVFLPSAIMQLLPYHEGALRGLQEDVGKHAVSATELRRLAKVLEASGPVLVRLAEALQHIPALPEPEKASE